MTPFVVPDTWHRRPSPNHGARPAGVTPTAIVLHADASLNVESTLDWLARKESQVSYHVLVSRLGRVFLVVPPERRAWHAGVSALGEERNCNDFALGVCLSNPNNGVSPYPEAQLASAARVVALLADHFGVPAARIVRHRDVALPAGRKSDPAPPAFDHLAFLARVAALRA